MKFPESFEKRMIETLGDNEWLSFKSAHEKSAPVSIRQNPKKTPVEGLRNVPWCSTGRYLEERPVFTLDPHFHAGAYYVQEASSMFLEQAISQHIDLGEPLTVLDLSAAPGGKSTHLLSLISGSSLLISNEVIRSRAKVLSENIQKWGFPNCIVTNSDPADFQNLKGFFDVILVDAPCSGEGLFRKEPGSMSEWSEQNVHLCAARQERILHDIWPALKENGLLIYATCTYNAQENEDNLIGFSKTTALEFLPIQLNPVWGVKEISKEGMVGYRLMPHKVDGEGFFISVVRKKEQAAESMPRLKHRLNPATKKSTERLESWIHNAAEFSFYQHQDLIFALPEQHTRAVETIINNVRFLYGGVNIATVKHDKYIPEHALAVSTLLNRAHFQTIAVDHATSLKYLRRDTLALPDARPGYALLTFEENALGWVNVLANRVNNLYPQEWRIRMETK